MSVHPSQLCTPAPMEPQGQPPATPAAGLTNLLDALMFQQLMSSTSQQDEDEDEDEQK